MADEKKKRQKREYKKYHPEQDALDFTFSYNDKEKGTAREVKRSTSVTEDDLRRVSLWKSDRVLSVSKNIGKA